MQLQVDTQLLEKLASVNVIIYWFNCADYNYCMLQEICM